MFNENSHKAIETPEEIVRRTVSEIKRLAIEYGFTLLEFDTDSYEKLRNNTSVETSANAFFLKFRTDPTYLDQYESFKTDCGRISDADSLVEIIQGTASNNQLIVIINPKIN